MKALTFIILSLFTFDTFANETKSHLVKTWAEYSKNHTPKYSTSFKWFQSEAELGDADAQNILAFMYSRGQGTVQNHIEALKWYTKSAEQGNANAQSTLGSMYENGNKVITNNKNSYIWYSLAAMAPDKRTREYNRNKRDIVAHKLSPKEFFEAQEEVAKLYERIS